ncbi:hypothetical protein ACG00X_20205 [Roseateles sp. BYS96W]|uniref:Amidohydrolase n=1 Tax=Pelomonas nitida TaxID=3299027 RepID=A0ABW7GB27_9BURK
MIPNGPAGGKRSKRLFGVELGGAEDFSFFQRLIPGLFFFVGVTPPDIDPAQAYANHSPRFIVDERGLEVGVRALAHLAVDYLESIRA